VQLTFPRYNASEQSGATGNVTAKFISGVTQQNCLERSKLDIRKNSFSHTVIDTWNSLEKLNAVINCNTVTIFKIYIFWWYDRE